MRQIFASRSRHGPSLWTQVHRALPRCPAASGESWRVAAAAGGTGGRRAVSPLLIIEPACYLPWYQDIVRIEKEVTAVRVSFLHTDRDRERCRYCTSRNLHCTAVHTPESPTQCSSKSPCCMYVGQFRELSDEFLRLRSAFQVPCVTGSSTYYDPWLRAGVLRGVSGVRAARVWSTVPTLHSPLRSVRTVRSFPLLS